MNERCGIQYTVGTPTPKRAKYAVYYWGYVVYHQTKQAADTTQSKLSYYEQEDSRIEKIR